MMDGEELRKFEIAYRKMLADRKKNLIENLSVNMDKDDELVSSLYLEILSMTRPTVIVDIKEDGDVVISWET